MLRGVQFDGLDGGFKRCVHSVVPLPLCFGIQHGPDDAQQRRPAKHPVGAVVQVAGVFAHGDFDDFGVGDDRYSGVFGVIGHGDF